MMRARSTWLIGGGQSAISIVRVAETPTSIRSRTGHSIGNAANACRGVTIDYMAATATCGRTSAMISSGIGAGQYVNGVVHTQTIDGFWSLLKRGIMGVFHRVSHKYLPLYNNRNNPDIFGAAIARRRDVNRTAKNGSDLSDLGNHPIHVGIAHNINPERC
jgi:hypothetical protein